MDKKFYLYHFGNKQDYDVIDKILGLRNDITNYEIIDYEKVGLDKYLSVLAKVKGVVKNFEDRVSFMDEKGCYEKKISVIVPVYNVEEYITKCLKSICEQTYLNLEIILVDDGSTDESGKICDEFAGGDNRIKVIHKTNGGLSDARNAGLEIATGEWIGFVDSDDYIHEQMYELLAEAMIEEHADIVYCKRVIVRDSVMENYVDSDAKESWLSLNALEKMYQPGFAGMATVAWNKLYKKEIFEHLRFPKGMFFEDNYIIHRVYEKAQKVVFIDRTLYFYMERGGSIMRKPYTMRSLDKLKGTYERVIFTKGKVPDSLYAKILADYHYYAEKHYAMVKSFFPKEKQVLKTMHAEYKKIFGENKKVFRTFYKKKYIASVIFYFMPNMWSHFVSKDNWL